MLGWLPMTIVTAIVSPSARPRPSMMAPTMPMRELRRTPMRIISQRVAPSARTASRWLFGTAVMMSRVSDEMIGRIMIARIMLAVSRPTPKFGAAKESRPAKMLQQAMDR